VVWTDKHTAAVAAALRHQHAAVPADRDKRDDFLRGSAYDEERLAADGHGEVITDFRQLLRAPHGEPLAIPDGLQLEIVKRG
jgi:hypothetical protein